MTRLRILVGVVALLAAGDTLAQQPGRTPTNSLNVFTAATEAHIQAELKATEEQKKQLDTAAKAFKQAVRIADAAPDEFRAALEPANASLKTALNAEQILRLRQIVAQRGVAKTGLVAYLRGTPGKALLAPTPEQEKRFEAITAETAAALKKAVLSDEPVEKLTERFAGIRQEHEKKLVDALTPAQQAKWNLATGTAFQDTPIRQPNPGAAFDLKNASNPPIPRLLATLTYLLEPDVQKDLELVADQVVRVKDAKDKYDAGLKEPTPAGLAATFRKAALVGEAEETAVTLLKEPQKARLEQLHLQEVVSRATFFVAVIREENLTEALKLTPEDVARITKAEADLRRVESFLRSETPILLGSTPARPNLAVEELAVAYRQKVKASLEKLLTPEEKTRWDALLGKPYQGKFPPTEPVVGRTPARPSP